MTRKIDQFMKTCVVKVISDLHIKKLRLKNMYIGKLHIDDDDGTDIICITIYSLMHDLLAYKYKKKIKYNIRFILTENMKDDLT